MRKGVVVGRERLLPSQAVFIVPSTRAGDSPVVHIDALALATLLAGVEKCRPRLDG
jgi:hypothetical protein